MKCVEKKMIECSDSEALELTWHPWGLQQCQRTRISLGHWKSWKFCQVNANIVAVSFVQASCVFRKFNNVVGDFNVWNAIWLERLVNYIFWPIYIYISFDQHFCILIETGICCLDLSFDLIWALIWALIFTHGSVVVLEIHNPHKINIKIHILSFDFFEWRWTDCQSLTSLYFALWLVSVFLYSPDVPAVYLSLFQPLGCENQAMPLCLS